MSVKTVVNLALKDPEFAAKLRKKAVKAKKSGKGSAAESDFRKLFAASAKDLPGLNVANVSASITSSIYKMAIAELLKGIDDLRS